MSYLNKNYSITSKARKPISKIQKTDSAFAPTQKQIDQAWKNWDGPKARKKKTD